MGCAAEAVDARLPSFARDLPGRTVVAAWGEGPLPRQLAEWLRRFEKIGLVRRDAGDVLVFESPASVEVGWASLAASHGFRDACLQLDPAATHHVYLDLQQLVEVGAELADMPPSWRERLVRGLGLRSLRSAMFGVRRVGASWSSRGVVLTTGNDAGLPGLLTGVTGVATHQPVVESGARLQLEMALDLRIVQRVFTAMTTDEGPTLVAGFAEGMGRVVDQILRSTTGRASVHASGDGSLVVAAEVADRNGLEAALDDLPAGLLSRLAVEFRSGWLVAMPDADGVDRSDDQPRQVVWQPPTATPSIPGPFVWGHLEEPGIGQCTFTLRRAAPDAIGVEIELGGS